MKIMSDKFRENRISGVLTGLMIAVMALSVMLIPVSANAAGSGVTVNDRNWRAYASRYAYDQMNADEKKLYDNLENICTDFVKSGTEDAAYREDKISTNGGTDVLTGYYLKPALYDNLTINQVAEVVQVFIYQNPQFYFTTVSIPCLYTTKEVYLPCYSEFADGEKRAAVTNDLFSKIDTLVSQISTNTTKYDKEKAAHDLICDMLVYDNEEGEFCQSIYSVFYEGKSVCLGYSLTFELLLNASGVNTLTPYSDYHAWNKIQLDDGNWYAVDVTWDDQTWGIWYGCYNKADATLCAQDAEDASTYGAHIVKSPNYFPEALNDYGSQPADVENETGNNEVSTPVTVFDDVNAEEQEKANTPAKSADVQTDVKSDTANTVEESSDVKASNDNMIEIKEDAGASDKVSENKNENKKNDIKIPAAKLSKVKAGAKKCTVTWKKTKGIDGYEIQLSTSKKFKKIAKKAKVSSSKTSATIKKLKKKTTYYVRIRTYKKVNGKTQTSNWSGVKKVTVK